jgi:hypothetical protein
MATPRSMFQLEPWLIALELVQPLRAVNTPPTPFHTLQYPFRVIWKS